MREGVEYLTTLRPSSLVVAVAIASISPDLLKSKAPSSMSPSRTRSPHFEAIRRRASRKTTVGRTSRYGQRTVSSSGNLSRVHIQHIPPLLRDPLF